MIVSDPSTFVQPGDLAHCTSASAVAFGIRLRETWPKIWLFTKLDIATHTAVVMEVEQCGVKKLGLLEMIPNGEHKSACQFTPFSNYLNQGNDGDRIICITRHPAMWQSDVRIAFCKEAITLWAQGESYDAKGALKWAFVFLKEVAGAYYCSEFAEHCALMAGFSYYRDKAYSYDIADDDVMPWPLQRSKFMQMVLK